MTNPKDTQINRKRKPSDNHSKHLDVEKLKRRLGPADETQIRLLLRVPPAQRLLTMLEMQHVVLTGWHERLRQSHPSLNDLDLCRLMFERLRQND